MYGFRGLKETVEATSAIWIWDRRILYYNEEAFAKTNIGS
jgi:hypothetical protein